MWYNVLQHSVTSHKQRNIVLCSTTNHSAIRIKVDPNFAIKNPQTIYGGQKIAKPIVCTDVCVY